jgi:hypothetical protein
MRIAMNSLRVWPRAKDVALGGKPDRLVLCPHHPDQFRRPASRAGALQADNLEHALTWNVFRTLELLPPAFWLRRLQARLQAAQTLEAAPQIVRVELWRALPLPPAQRLIDPDRTEPMADIVIETEHAVWTLMIRRDDWLEDHEAGSDPVARLIDAGSWFAGARDYHFGLIVLDPDSPPVAKALVQRYGRSESSLSLRSGSRSGPKVNVRGVGLMCWADLAAVLRDCEESRVLSDIERALAGNALTWLAEIGIVPTAERSI